MIKLRYLTRHCLIRDRRFTHLWTIIDTYLYLPDNSIVSFHRICADGNKGGKGAEKVILVIKGRWLFWNPYKVHFIILNIYKTLIMWFLHESSTMRAKPIFKLFIFEIFMAQWISKFAFSQLNNWFCILRIKEQLTVCFSKCVIHILNVRFFMTQIGNWEKNQKFLFCSILKLKK